MNEHANIAAVVIGRNEGTRLETCLQSLSNVRRIVYVDSGSTDNSITTSHAMGAEVVTLDTSVKFTAARARNAGLNQLRNTGERPVFVQFVDGDCEVHSNWLLQAESFLESAPDVAVVCGRRRERFPDATPYNAQCDREWNTPIGPALACGGDALIRLNALDQVDGYNPELIAGEEPEMCVRLRALGWGVYRLDAEMTLHDANMTKFFQFWKRARRAGHAFAEGTFMHGAAPENHFKSETKRAIAWGIALPIAIVLASVTSWLGLLLAAAYPLQIIRMARRNGNTKPAWEEAALLTVSKIAEGQGVLEFYLRRVTGRKSKLIEYK